MAALAEACWEEHGVDVFVVDALRVEGPGGVPRSVPGVAASIPVAAGTRSRAAPVVVEGSWTQEDAEAHTLLGVRMAHELGHALGLFHPREADAPDGTYVVDNLEDTPEDPSVLPGWLMHRAPTRVSTRTSDGQRARVTRSPVLR